MLTSQNNRFYRAIIYIIDNFEPFIIKLLFSLMVIILGAQVFTRYLFGFTFSWAEQVARIFFVWITFAGISYAVKDRLHLRVTLFVNYLPDKARKFIEFIGCAIAMIFGYYIAWSIFNIILIQIEMGQKFSSIPALPVWIMYLGGALGMFGMSSRYVIHEIIPFFSKIKK